MFTIINPKEIKDNLIKAISEEYMLISAGNENGYNMMTASWGFTGEIWGEDSVVALVRPERYTMEFIDKNDLFTLSFYGDNREIHKICGSRSGRDCNKTELCGLTPVFDRGTVYFGAYGACLPQAVYRQTEAGMLYRQRTFEVVPEKGLSQCYNRQDRGGAH